jgi:hypothetical protein
MSSHEQIIYIRTISHHIYTYSVIFVFVPGKLVGLLATLLSTAWVLHTLLLLSSELLVHAVLN